MWLLWLVVLVNVIFSVLADHDAGLDAFHSALELFRVNREDGTIEFVEHEDLYNGPNSERPLNVVTFFGTTAAGKSATCRFLSCALGAPTAFPSSYGIERNATRGLWGSHIIVHPSGNHFVLLDIEGFDNLEQDKRVAEAVLKLLALLSEVTSTFVLVKVGGTAQTSDLERIASFVQDVRNTLLQRPATITEIVGAYDNFPALVMAHILETRLSAEEVKEEAWKVVERAEKFSPDVIKTINENYIEMSEMNDGRPSLHLTYMPLYKLPSGRHMQEMIDSSQTPGELRRSMEEWEDLNQPQNRPERMAGITYLQDMDALRDLLLHISVPRRDGQSRPITAASFRQLLQIGIREMNQVGPLSSVRFWKKIEIDACTRELETKVDMLVAKISSHVFESDDAFSSAFQMAEDELLEFFQWYAVQAWRSC